jgi:hypothetical protein
MAKKKIEYIHIVVKPKTYERFFKLGGFKDTADDIVSKLIDSYLKK